MTRGGRTKDRDEGAERRCIATGRTLPPARMVRFVLSPDGAIVPDVLGRLPGRGIWVSADRAAFRKVTRGNAFQRAARQKAIVPEGLADTVEALLARRVVELMSLARRAGEAVAGMDKVKALLETDTAAALFQASDGSPGQKRKLRPPEGPDAYFDSLSGAELGQAFGREIVIHAALTGGGLTSRVVEEAARLRGMRAIPEKQG